MKYIKKVISILLFLIILISSVNIFIEDVAAREVSGIQDGKVFRLKNVKTQRYIYVSGTSNNSNIYMRQKDSTVSNYMDFRFNYDKSSGKYRLVSMRNTSRAMDRSTSGANNIQLYDIGYPNDQLFDIVHFSENTYRLKLGSMYLTCNDGTGSSSGTATNSTGNVYMAAYNGYSEYQLWIFEEVSPTSTSGVKSGEVYSLRNKQSNMYLDVKGNGTSSGTLLQQYPYINQLSEQFKITYVSNGYYRIQSMHNSLYMDSSSNPETYTNVKLVTQSNNNNQLWKIIPNGDGTYRFSPKNNEFSMCLAIDRNNIGNSNANALLYPYGVDNGYDRWYLELVTTTVSHSGKILIGSSSDNYSTSSCSFPKVSATNSADALINELKKTGGANEVEILFHRQNSQASISDLISKWYRPSITIKNVDDVDFMFFSGHNTVAGGFHYTYLPNGNIHNSETEADANYKQNQTYWGEGTNTRTKWVLAYSCNFLTKGSQSPEWLLKGDLHMVLGYKDSRAYFVDLQMKEFGKNIKDGKFIIDSFINSGHYNTQYHDENAILAVVYRDVARSDTLYRYAPSQSVKDGTKMLYEQFYSKKP